MTETILDRLDQHARQRSGEAGYFHKTAAGWTATSWSEFSDQVRLAAAAFVALGVGPGSTVGILGFNRPEWTTSVLAAMATGGAAAGIYTTNAANQVAYILDHAESVVAVVENREQWDKVAAVRDQLPQLERIVVMEAAEAPDDAQTISWSQLLELGAGVPPKQLEERRESLRPEQLATLIYTSGTTGPPKGVMLSHDNLVATSRICGQVLASTAEDRALSYLPLAHVAEQMLSIHVPVFNGYPVYYAESIDKMLDNLREVRPTVMFGVPRVWERMHTGLSGRMEAAQGIKKLLAQWAMGVGRRTAEVVNGGGQPGPWLAWQGRLARRLVHDKVRAALGLDQVRICASGAAPIAVEVLQFFAGFGLSIHEVYGQSEGCGPTTWNRPGSTRFGTVGPALPEVEVRLAEDSEVLVRGPNIFLGYLKDPAATAEALDSEGWLHSGDLGSLDGRGFLTITGRKKEIMITSGGKNIAPNNIESALKQIDLVGDAVLIAEGRKFIAALLSLDPERIAGLAEELSVPESELAEHPEVRRRLAAGVEQVNAGLSRVEQVRAFRALPRPLSIEGGELTPTLKVKRQVVEERYADLIEQIYAAKPPS